MSEPFWTPLGGQPVDYEGPYNPATQYAPGDVVTYQGVTYLAVNPSLGSTPPPSLPVSPYLSSAFPLDRAGLLVTPEAQSDEFSTPGLASKWVALGTAAQVASVADPLVAPEGFQHRMAASISTPFSSFMQAITPPFTVYAKVASANLAGTSCRRGGIIFGPANPTTSSPNLYFGSFSTSASVAEARAFRSTNWGTFAANFASVPNVGGVSAFGPMWLKVAIPAGGLTFSTWASLDGHVWVPGDQGTAHGLGAAIGSVGLGHSTENYAGQSIVNWDYFRVVSG